jgi:hypothetical protein
MPLFSSHIWQCVLSYSWLDITFNSIQDFAPVFIMLRVAFGRARPETEWSGKISGLQFTSNPGGRAGASASADGSRSHGTSGGFGTNTILTVSRSHLEHEVDIEARDHGINDEDSLRGKENEKQIC